MARVEDPQAEYGPVARVGVQQQAQRIGDHAVRGPGARPQVAGRVRRRRAALGEQVVGHASDRAGRHRRRAHEAHGRTLPIRAGRLWPACGRGALELRWAVGSDMIGAMATAARDRHQACVRVRAALAAVVALLFCAPAASAQLQPGGRQATVPGELLVQFEPGVSPSARADVRAAAGTHVQSALREPGLQLLDVEPGTSVPEAIRRLERSADVSFAQPNIVYHAAAVVPNDPYFANHDLWGLETIRAPEAWATTVGSPSVTVAVVDSGIASDHPDLTANVDTSRGRDFVDDGFLDGAPGGSDGFDARADPSDHNGHGTHVAGTIAARGNNGRGIAGVTWNSTLVSVRVLDGHAYGESDDLANGLDYACDI